LLIGLHYTFLRDHRQSVRSATLARAWVFRTPHAGIAGAAIISGERDDALKTGIYREEPRR
jgi:hypothetical protein